MKRNASNPPRPPLIDERSDCTEGASSWLGRISRDGQLTVGTHISGILVSRVIRSRDRGVLLSGIRQRVVTPQPFMHYTKPPIEESDGILLKLNERCDSVLLGVNLDFLGDSLHLVSLDETERRERCHRRCDRP